MRILSRRYCKNFSSKIYLQSTIQIGFSQTGDQNWLQLQNPFLVYYSWYHTVGFFGDTTTKTKSLLFKKEKNKLLFKKEKKRKIQISEITMHLCVCLNISAKILTSIMATSMLFFQIYLKLDSRQYIYTIQTQFQ